MAETEERKLFLLVTSRAFRANSRHLFGEFALRAGDGGFLKIRNSYCFFS